MKKSVLGIFAFLVFVATSLTGCYSYNTVVGQGPQKGVEVQKWNHYVLFGLAPVGVSNPAQVAGDAQDYNVNTKITFVNGLVAGLTFGLYTPTTTTITK